MCDDSLIDKFLIRDNFEVILRRLKYFFQGSISESVFSSKVSNCFCNEIFNLKITRMINLMFFGEHLHECMFQNVHNLGGFCSV